MTNLIGYFLKGIVVRVPRVLSFRVRICLSTSPTCSLAAAQLHMTFFGKWSWTGWNSISRRITCTLYEARAYKRQTLARELPSCSAVLEGMYSTVQNFIFLDTVNKKVSQSIHNHPHYCYHQPSLLQQQNFSVSLRNKIQKAMLPHNSLKGTK